MQSALDLFLRRFITVGRLTVEWPVRRTQTYAGPTGSGPEARVALRDRRTVRRIELNPEAPLDGTIHDVLAVLVANLRANPNGVPVTWLRRWAAHHVDRSRLHQQHVERVHVVQLAVGDVDEARDAAAGGPARCASSPRPWSSNQPLRELGVDPPIACLVGVCQRGAVHCSRKPMW
jgi:hypothetical protein